VNDRGISHQAEGLTETPRPRTPWLCVAGAKGGVGKTTLSSNLALLLARAGYRTLLVDFDLGTGNVGVHLRLQARRDLDDVFEGRCSARAAVVPGPGRIDVLLGRSGPTRLTTATADEVDALLQDLREVSADFDVVVFDTGSGLHASTLGVAARCDLTLGVTTPDVASLTDAYALCKVLHARGLALPHLVVNRARTRDEAMSTAAKLDTVCRRFLGATSPLAGWVCDEPLIAQSAQEQRPVALSDSCRGLDDLRSVSAAALAALPPLRRRREPCAQPTRRVRLRPPSADVAAR
jgi:flagellar biosynthesis protein FlhG